MNWKIIKTEEDYKIASLRMMEIFHALPNTPEHDELELLMVLVKDFDEKNYHLPEIEPLEIIKYKMEEMGVKNKDLEILIGSKGHVSAVLSGKREITLKIAQKLKTFFNIPAEVFLPSI